MNKYTVFFYFLSFLEGASVMAAELLGAKMLAPYFGTSLYVWSSVLAVTLGGLASGYFAGGIISAKKNNERNLYYILLASAVFLMAMPFLARAVMVHTVGLGLLESILFSSLIFLFPPVFCMGMVSPLIVECIIAAPPPIQVLPVNSEKEIMVGSGKTAGIVFAISTVGGILATFFLGFYCIPAFGLTMPAIIFGVVIGIIPFFKLITKKYFVSLIFLPIVIGTAFFSFSSSKLPPESSDVEILYSSEGLLGQIIVADYPLYEQGKKVNGSQRILFVNRSTQTVITSKGNKKTFFEYVHMISLITKPHPSFPSHQGEGNDSPAIGEYPRQSRDYREGERHKALVLGLGGGSVANELTKNGFEVDAVELDSRTVDVAKKYFDLSGKVDVFIDDARHHLNEHKAFIATKHKYDVIVLDAFVGEVNPHHLFTQEFFKDINSILSDSGTFFINGNGYWTGRAGKGMRSICKTLINSGFNVEVMPTQEEEDYRNLVFIAKKSEANVGIARSSKMSDISLDDAVVLLDEKPELEILNAEANKRWREACMKYFLSGYYSRQDMLLFK